MKPYALGIDTGGTYTDAVIIDLISKEIIFKFSTFTTHSNLSIGIKIIFQKMENFINDIEYIVLSTTLATNSVLEGKIENSCLILIGNKNLLSNKSMNSINYKTFIDGGHDYYGNEICPLDIASLKKFIIDTQNYVSSYAVSSYFSIRNNIHEKKAKFIINKLTKFPCVCGYEINQSLNIYDRGVTAYLNASLLDKIGKFILVIINIIRNYNKDIKINILSCKGSVLSLNEAKLKPIETILSGPAASLIGVSFLTKMKSYIMIDIGGTSTDIGMVIDGIPILNSEGSIINQWKTNVESVYLNTIAFGGDSHIWIKGFNGIKRNIKNNIFIGPIRVIPLCRASKIYPSFINQLKMRWFSDISKFGLYIQPVTYYVKSSFDNDIKDRLSKREIEVYSRIKEIPTSIFDIMWGLNYVRNII